MSGAGSYIPWEADELERLTKDLPNDENDEVWRVYGQRGFDSAAVVANNFKAQFKARFKVIGDTPPPEVLAALDAAYRSAGDWTAIITALQQLGAPAKARVLTDSGDQSAPLATKSYNPQTDPFARMLEADQTK